MIVFNQYSKVSVLILPGPLTHLQDSHLPYYVRAGRPSESALSLSPHSFILPVHSPWGVTCIPPSCDGGRDTYKPRRVPLRMEPPALQPCDIPQVIPFIVAWQQELGSVQALLFNPFMSITLWVIAALVGSLGFPKKTCTLGRVISLKPGMWL